MIKKISLTLFAVLSFAMAGFAQQNKGAIKVTLTDGKTKEAIPFANIIVLKDGSQVGVGTTDIDGNAMIKPLDPGKYDVKAVYVGYQAREMKGVIVGGEKTSYVNIALSNEEGVKLDEVLVVEYQEPLIDPDTKSGGTITREEYQNMATKNILSVASTTAGVFQAEEGGAVNVRGSRSGGTQIFIDGERAIGTTNIPQQGVEQVSVILGGLPAQYGDATGGVISVTTRGTSSKFFGGVEAISSQLTDKYGYNFLGFSVGGPLLARKDSSGNKTALLGFFLAGEAVFEKDDDPSYFGNYKVADEKMKSIEERPLIRDESGVNYYAAEFLKAEDLVKVKARQNVARRSFRLSPKIDFVPTPNIKITLGGTWDYLNRHSYIYDYALFNSSNNPQTIQNTMRGYVRLTQKFGKESSVESEKSQSVVKNVFFSLQLGYQKYKAKTQDDTHKDKFFDYGYIGKFKQYNKDTFFLLPNVDSVYVNGVLDTLNDTPWLHFQYPTYSSFTPSDINPIATNYTSQVYNDFGATNVNGEYFTPNITSFSDVGGYKGLLNGDRPANIHSLWLSSGRQYSGYAITDNSQIRLTSSLSADIKNHAILIGIEYDQRDERAYSISPTGLFSRMRQLANSHISVADKFTLESASLDPYSTGANPSVGLTYVYNASAQSYFSQQLLEALGLPKNTTQEINVDQYDPSQFKIEMFSPDELLNGGSSVVDAYGYDYYGNRLKSNVNFNDFLTKTNDSKVQGTHERLVGGFKPIYMAGYIQDKFDFKDIKFNVGVRFDRYDANQKVLKDKYSLKTTYKVGDLVQNGQINGTNIPSNVPTTAVIYVDDEKATTPGVVGFRDGDTWYDVAGNEVDDPKLIAEKTATGVIAPYLINPNNNDPYENDAFKDYKPQINIMPRIAFSFPISDVSNFFAHYDVLTQRPTGNRLDPKDYMYMTNNQGGLLNNPDLQSEKTIDYELGFSQILNEKKNAALKLSAFYREMRNMVQVTRINQAYPISYLTYGNIDFGTVKGFSAEFDLRRSGGVSLTANYTLQFAEGSGSNASGGYSLASSSQPNLRVTLPLDFDQRHTITTVLDYRFGEGNDYRGPKWNRKKGGDVIQILKNVGANLTFRMGSGTPYSRQNLATTDVMIGVSQSPSLVGELNGSRLPWQFRADLRIDKNLELVWGKKDSEKRKKANLNIYLQVMNLFNSKNILRVHAYNGDPYDDGYLTATTSNQALTSIQSQGAERYDTYLMLYRAKLVDPTYFGRPRQIRIGLQLDFN